MNVSAENRFSAGGFNPQTSIMS